MTSQLGPLVVGTLAVLGLAVYLAFEDPSPGGLASAHAALHEFDGLAGCEQCHTPQGLAPGCLACHSEIRSQLRERTGYHADRGDCAGCHPEHAGASFDLVGAVAWKGDGPEGFDHADTAFRLENAHLDLACDACHFKKPFTLPGFSGHERTFSYLGLGQECLDCHEDIHGGGDFHDCARCHDQRVFKPAARFDHGEHFPLLGGHAGAKCGACHRLENPDDRSYDRVKGKACRDCHESPHRTDFQRDCEACHAREAPPFKDARTSFTPALHARTGFSIAKPHEEVACKACHADELPYAGAHRDPPRAQRDCAACHGDPHRGQFAPRTCLECHAEDRFQPSLFDRDRHETFRLDGAHARADCKACHREDEAGVRRFTGLEKSCAACHEDTHRGQFAPRSCEACHDVERFAPSKFGLARHAEVFSLKGAHQAVACLACHRADARGTVVFAGAPASCRECHEDPHANQFGPRDCAECHRKDSSTFRIRPFDHARRTGYALVGEHVRADCTACHVKDRGGVRRFRQQGTRCADCHTDVHRGQFRRRGVVDCARCHHPEGPWTALDRFDHDRDSRFALDKSHERVDCSACHRTIRQPDGSGVVQYRPLKTQCKDCHEIDRR